MKTDPDNNTKGKKILLVEDDAYLARIIGKKMDQAGYVFFHAPDGESSFEILKDNIPDVIMLDILLPGEMDGFAILEKVKANKDLKNIPVIILSNLGQPSDVERGMNLGAFHYVVKASIAPDEILGYVESAVNSTIKK